MTTKQNMYITKDNHIYNTLKDKTHINAFPKMESFQLTKYKKHQTNITMFVKQNLNNKKIKKSI